jgi:protein-tyrosine phosphatase
MIDLHTHILPEVDDGVKSMEEAVLMIKEGAEIGITDICATPHLSCNFNSEKAEKIMQNFSELKQRITRHKINVKLYGGSEVDIRMDTKLVKNLPFFFLNHSQKYILLELPIGEFPSFAEKVFFSLLIEGLSPILAHPERSLARDEDFKRLEKLVDSGVLIQLNAGSLSGRFGKKIREYADRLLQKELVDLISSDAHDLESRPITSMAEAYKKIKNHFGAEKAQELFEENPQKILQAENIEKKRAFKSF